MPNRHLTTALGQIHKTLDNLSATTRNLTDNKTIRSQPEISNMTWKLWLELATAQETATQLLNKLIHHKEE